MLSNTEKRKLFRDYYEVDLEFVGRLATAETLLQIDEMLKVLAERYPQFFKINNGPSLMEDFNSLFEDSKWKYDVENKFLFATSKYIGLIRLPFNVDPSHKNLDLVKSAAINQALNFDGNYLSILKARLMNESSPIVPIEYIDVMVSDMSDIHAPVSMSEEELKVFYKKVFLRDLKQPLAEDGMTDEEFKELRGYPRIRPSGALGPLCVVVSLLGEEAIIRADGKICWADGIVLSSLGFSEVFRNFMINSALDQNDIADESIAG